MPSSLKIGFGSCVCCRNKSGRERGEDRLPPGVPDFCNSCEEAGIQPPDLSVHTIPVETSVVVLDASEAFQGLTEKERQYAQALSAADWEGAKICLLQCSPESVPIFSLLQLVFSAQSVDDLKVDALAAGLTDAELDQAMMYCASFYGNVGNYKSFGDTKFVPELQPARMYTFLTAGIAEGSRVEELWAECGERMYSLKPRERQLGLGAEKGLSTYFSSNCEESDAEVAGRFLESLNLSPYNTRLFKIKQDGAGNHYTIVLASAKVTSSDDTSVKRPRLAAEDPVSQLCGTTRPFEGHHFTVELGDYAPLMSRVAGHLRRAIPVTANPEQTAMMTKYVESFELGSIEAHKDASRHWIKDKGPAVESYIGFIESYRDPSGSRGEWEGFVACVNREVSKKFQILVDQAEELLTKMPWPTDFEKDTFLRPDFTSLDVMAFGSSGVPAGINIPNYDDIRQSEGFKNVSLGNVLAASYGAKGAKPVTFLLAEDQEMYKDLQGKAFEVQVGIHELLGHGSGKLFNLEEKATFENVMNPLTGQKVTGPFYAPGTTWDTKFGKIASSYEECRAECTGLYLCLENEALAAFGHPGAEGSDVVDLTYINWLHMARAGLLGLEYYTPETGQHRQAHMQARYVILRVLLEAGGGLLELRSTVGSDGKPDVLIVMNRSLIRTVGKQAIGDFLLKLQVHKTLGDFEAGSAMYNRYSEVPAEMLTFRGIVMARKEPRKIMVQPHLSLSADGKVALTTFENSPAGMIESFVARFPAEDEELYKLYLKEKPMHSY